MEDIQIKEGTFYQTTLAKVHAFIIVDTGKITKGAVKWAHRNHCHAFVAKLDADISAFGRIISFLHSQGIRKIGILELSEQSHMALAVAATHPQVTLTIVSNPDITDINISSIRGFLMCIGTTQDPVFASLQQDCQCVCMPFQYDQKKNQLLPRSMLPIGYHLGVHGKARQDMDEHMQNIVKIWVNQR